MQFYWDPEYLEHLEHLGYLNLEYLGDPEYLVFPEYLEHLEHLGYLNLEHLEYLEDQELLNHYLYPL